MRKRVKNGRKKRKNPTKAQEELAQQEKSHSNSVFLMILELELASFEVV